MDLLEHQQRAALKKQAPLAARMRPKTLAEFVGQSHIVGANELLYRAIEADRLTSLIFYGPPGTGKTTLAQVIAHSTKGNFVRINATAAGVKDIQAAVKNAQSLLGMSGKRSILFIDEIHRFNKRQQDVLLPYVEDGTVILIGATTENPFFEVNKALISRSLVLELFLLGAEDIKKLLRRAIDTKNGYFDEVVELTDDALSFIGEQANGDARKALNALELGVLTTKALDGVICITLEIMEQCIQKRAILYDKGGDMHYDAISAFIKSMRGSDPDAALYYLARMIHGGEDLRFIARRIIICASEDVGNADPQALILAESAARASDYVGFPEAELILAQAAIYVACAPKSNAVLGIFEAKNAVETITIQRVPPHLQDASRGSKALNRGQNYLYPHAYPNHYIKQAYLPEELEGSIFYKPSLNGYERRISEFLTKIRGETEN